MDLILTARGLNTNIGRVLIKDAVKRCFNDLDISSMRIALLCLDFPELEDMFLKAAKDIGFKHAEIIRRDLDFTSMNLDYNAWYLGEGNTFSHLDFIKSNKVVDDSIKKSRLVIGSSAGALLCASSIEVALDFDENTVGLKAFDGLDIMPKNNEDEKTTIVPHYTFKEFKRWKRYSDPNLINSYNHIYYVSNNQYIYMSDSNVNQVIRGEYNDGCVVIKNK